MKERQKYEISVLDYIIENGRLKHWDGINMGASGKAGADLFEEGGKRFNPEQAFFRVNGRGDRSMRSGNIDDIVRLNKLLEAKRTYDLQMKAWIQDAFYGLISPMELYEDGLVREADILASKMVQSIGKCCLLAHSNLATYLAVKHGK